MGGNTNGGPSGRDVFDLRNVAVETVCLLLSSFSCGMASVAAGARNKPAFYAAMVVTFVLGLAFISLEVREFVSLIRAGDGPSRSAFLSAFFALVGYHGVHVSAGLLWLLIHDRPGGTRRDSARRSCAGSSASACFGTPSTSSPWVAVFYRRLTCSESHP